MPEWIQIMTVITGERFAMKHASQRREPRQYAEGIMPASKAAQLPPAISQPASSDRLSIVTHSYHLKYLKCHPFSLWQSTGLPNPLANAISSRRTSVCCSCQFAYYKRKSTTIDGRERNKDAKTEEQLQSKRRL